MRAGRISAIVAGVLLWHLTLTSAWAYSSGSPEPKITAPFDQELFDLAYSVFLANSNLTEALAVTELAIQTHPTDNGWRSKGAQTAEWAGRAELALQHWFFLAQRGDKGAAQSALRISRSLNELPLRKQLLEQMVIESDQLALQKEYIAVVEGLGLPEEGYALLSSGRLRQVDPVWLLSEQARLAESLGRPEEAFAAWKKRVALKPLNSEEALQLASLWYGQGNAPQALKVLQAAAKTTPGETTIFWRTFTDLSWTLQEIPDAIMGAELLVRNGTAAESDFQRIQMVFQESDPAMAYLNALEGWRRFSKPTWWIALVTAGLRSGHLEDLLAIFTNMTPERRLMLSRDAGSWYSLSQVYRQKGDIGASLMAARTAVGLEPSNADLLSSYLWLLIDLKQTAELKYLLRGWEERIVAFPELREPLAAAMMMLGEPERALRHYRIIARLRYKDPAWLASYADVLEQAGHPESAWRVRRHAHLLLAGNIRSAAISTDNQLRDLMTQANLLMRLSPGDALSALIHRIVNSAPGDTASELVMGWAMASAQTDLARFWYWRKLARTVDRPEWAQLGLALEENDQPTIAELVESHLERLPYRDAIEGARRVGMTPVAETYAFERLHLNPQDHLLDQQMRELSSVRPGLLAHSLQLEDQAGVGWIQNRITFSQPITARYSLKADMSERQFSSLKENVIGILPSHDIEGGLTLTRRHKQGYTALSLGARDAGFNNLATAAFEGTWQLFRDMTISGRFDYNGRSDESAPLSIAGVRDRLRLTANANLTPKDTLSLELAGANYHDHYRHYLGQAMSLNMDLRHQITSAWPDYGIRSYGGYTATTTTGTLPDSVKGLMPVDSAPSASFFVPDSFGQLGIGAFVGQNWKNVYSRDIKPFAEMDIGWTTTAGFGFNYGLGISSPIFGFDQMKLEFHQGLGKFGLNGLTSSIDMEYRYFY